MNNLDTNPDSGSKSPESNPKCETVNRSRRAFILYCGAAAIATAIGMRDRESNRKLWHEQHRKDEKTCHDSLEENFDLEENDRKEFEAYANRYCDHADGRMFSDVTEVASHPTRFVPLAKEGVAASTHSVTAYARTALETVLEYFISRKSGEVIREHDEKEYEKTYCDHSGFPNNRDIPSYEDYRIKTGNRSLLGMESKMARYIKNPRLRKVIMGMGAVIGAPIVEELIFRLAASEIFVPKTDTGYAWRIGIPSTVCFALIHNGRERFDQHGIRFEFDYSVPVQQTILGAYAWYAMRRPDGGITHSILAHAIHNAICGGDHYLENKTSEDVSEFQKPQEASSHKQL